ncbi:MAG: FecR domain-containing protein [Gammaproteobacteria bacterium]
MSTNARNLRTRIALAALIALYAGAASAADRAAEVVTLQGQATAASGDGEVRGLGVGAPVKAGDTVNTNPNTYLRMKFTDGSFVILRPNTRFAIEAFEDTNSSSDRSVFNLLKGGLRTVTGLLAKRNRAGYQLKSPVATIGIRGTDYELRLCQGDCSDVEPAPPDGAYAVNHSGCADVANDAGSQEMCAGTYIYASGPDGAPQAISAAQAAPLTVNPIPPADPADCP